MKTIEIKLYKFSELSKESKQKAVEKYYNFNVESDWWQFTYEDAKTIGLKITGFDIDNASYCRAEFIETGLDCAIKIKDEHGESAETYKAAITFIEDYDKMFKKYEDKNKPGYIHEDNENDFDDELNDLEAEFLKSISEDYKTILKNEFEYLTSNEAVQEALISNEYDFTEDGKIY